MATQTPVSSNSPVFDKVAWSALVAHVCTNEERININQIAIWQDGLAAATDGHRLLMCRPHLSDAWDADRGDPEFLVSRDDAKRALKLMKSRDMIEVCDHRLRVISGRDGVDAVVELPCGHSSEIFVPVHQCVNHPTKKPERTMGVDPAYLAETCTHFARILKSTKEIRPVRMTTGSSRDPICIEASDLERDWYALVMPFILK